MPSLTQQAKQVVREGARWVLAGMPFASPDDREARRSICQECDARDGARCRLCGCFIDAKTALATSECPADPPKWRSVPGSNQVPRPPGSWFDRPDRRAALQAELESWRGTRFWAHSRGRATKGVRADCVSFVAQVLVNLGTCPPIQFPAYVTHNGGRQMRQVLLDALGNVPGLRQIWAGGPRPKLLPGDLLAGSSGTAMHHLAIMGTQGEIWHCTEHGGVTPGTLEDPMLSRHLMGIYRFTP